MESHSRYSQPAGTLRSHNRSDFILLAVDFCVVLLTFPVKSPANVRFFHVASFKMELSGLTLSCDFKFEKKFSFPLKAWHIDPT